MSISTPAPRSPVGADGAPLFGAYRGYADEVTWAGLSGGARRSALWRRLHQKTWHYASIAGEASVVALAIVDVGLAASAFAYVFDRRSRRLLADLSFTALPGAAAHNGHPGPGASARFSSRRARFSIAHEADGAWHVRGRAGDALLIDAHLDPTRAPPPLCAIAAIEGGVANCTHKTVGLAARGHVLVKGERFDLEGHAGALDHTRGLLARDTRWRWANASSPTLSLNLVEDFNGPVENVVWIGDTLVPVGPVRFDFDPKRTSRPWSIRAADNSLELEFVPEGERREDKDLILAKSRYVQPIGTFRGVLRPPGAAPVEVRDLVGVTEDHVARW
jgi:hypothetical protein